MEDNKEARALELMARYFSGDIKSEEQTELMEWVEASESNQAFFADTSQLWEASEQVDPEPMTVDTKAAWVRLDERLEAPARVVSMTSSRTKIWRRVAAAIVLIIGIGLGWQQWGPAGNPAMVEVETSAGERRELTLPDDSRILLEEDSRIAYPDDFAERTLTLEGAARFSVTSDPQRPFTIQAGDLKTTVLGTQFTVRAYPNEERASVKVAEGRVAVEAPAGQQAGVPQRREVAAGEAVEYQKQASSLVAAPPPGPNENAWVTGVLTFEDVPLGEVVTVLEDYYNVTIKTQNPALNNCRIRITFEQESLDNVLEQLSFIGDFEVAMDSDTFLLDGDGCPED
jgi:transmembrane sensor